MKYPILSNWISCERISDSDAYRVKNRVWDKECILSAQELWLAGKLDGKTDPYSLDRQKNRTEVKQLIDKLTVAGVIDAGRGLKYVGGGMLVKSLVKARNSRMIRLLSRFLNTFLMAAFLPMLVFGRLVYSNIRLPVEMELSAFESFLYENRWNAMIAASILGILTGSLIHELCHANACRAYGGEVFEYGIVISIFPGFYTMMNPSVISSRLKKIQVMAAGIEGNVLYSGILYFLSALFPGAYYLLAMMATVNLFVGMLNLFVCRDLDGMRILMQLIGMEEANPMPKIKRALRSKKKRKKLKSEGLTGYMKLTAGYMLVCAQWAMPPLLLLDILVITGVLR